MHGDDDNHNEYFEAYPADVSCVDSGLRSIDADTWSEVLIPEDTKKQKKKNWKTLGLNNEISTHNRHDVLQNIDEKITAMEIMTVSTEEKPRRDKMRAIGKGPMIIDSGAAESVIPKDMFKEYVTTKEAR